MHGESKEKRLRRKVVTSVSMKEPKEKRAEREPLAHSCGKGWLIK
jgi:hypothetical protein